MQGCTDAQLINDKDLQACPSRLSPACLGTWRVFFPATGLDRHMFSLSWDSSLPVSPDCQGLSEWQCGLQHINHYHNTLISTSLLKGCFDSIRVKTFNRRNQLQMRGRHRGIYLSKLTRPVVRPGLNYSCPWSECQGCLTESLLRLISCTHVSKETLAWCRRNFLLEQLLIWETNTVGYIGKDCFSHFSVLA